MTESGSVASSVPPAADRWRKIESRPLHVGIQEVLIGMGLRSGDPVPSELELMEILGVSRGSLREALKQLQALEIIETRHGTGMFIASFSLAALVDGLVFHNMIAESTDAVAQMADLADVREILETQLIRRVAESIDDASVTRIRSLFDAMVQVDSDSATLDAADWAFHAGLYEGLGNVFVLKLLEAFWKVLRLVRPALLDTFTGREQSLSKHEDIVRALEARDPDAAERAMRAHFSGTRAWLIGAQG